MKGQSLGLFLGAALMLTAVPAVQAQTSDWPSRPVTFVLPFPAGSITDMVARVVSDKLRQKHGQTFIVENKAGASGNVGADLVARSAPDGHTFLFTPPPPLITNKALYNKLSYDPEAMEPVIIVVSWANILGIHPKLGIKTLPELLAYARANPGKLNYCSNGNGTTPHLTAEMFKMQAKVDIQHIPYRGAAPALADLLAGQVDMGFIDISTSLPHVRSGKLIALAVTGEKRSAELPDVPALNETLPDIVSTAWAGVAAPHGTPLAVREQLARDIAAILKMPDVAAKLKEWVVEPVGSTPAQTAGIFKQERERWGTVIRATGARVD